MGRRCCFSTHRREDQGVVFMQDCAPSSHTLSIGHKHSWMTALTHVTTHRTHTPSVSDRYERQKQVYTHSGQKLKSFSHSPTHSGTLHDGSWLPITAQAAFMSCSFSCAVFEAASLFFMFVGPPLRDAAVSRCAPSRSRKPR